MGNTLPADEAGVKRERQLPPGVQGALGELVGAAREGLMALSVGVGLGVLAELMEEEVTEVVGRKGRHDPERTAVRHGHRSGELTLGGRRVGVERPRVRASDDSGELELEVYRHFADRDPLSRIVTRAHARRGLVPALRAHAGRRGRAGQRIGARDLKVIDLTHLHRAHPPGLG